MKITRISKTFYIIFENTIQKIIKMSVPDVSVTKRNRVQQKHPILQI